MINILVTTNKINIMNDDYKRIVKSNDSILYKKEYLIKMLLKLDNILSENDSYIKTIRKRLIIKINSTLDYIDELLIIG